MLDFFKKHWFILSLTALALAATAITIFFPPAILVAATLALASAPAFAFLGTYAVAAAITTTAVVAAASVYAIGAIGYGLFKAFESVRDYFKSKSAKNSSTEVIPNEELPTNDDKSEETSTSKMQEKLGANPTIPEQQEQVEEIAHHTSPLITATAPIDEAAPTSAHTAANA